MPDANGRVPSFRIRNAAQSDNVTVRNILLEAFREVAERQFGPRAEVEHRTRLTIKLSRVRYRLIEIGDHAVGVVATSLHDDHVFLDDLAVLPSHQGRGIGSAVLRLEVEHAHRLGKPLRLHTPRVGQAVPFYVRHGFVETGRGEDFVDFENAPST